LAIAAMFEKQKQVEDYRLQHPRQSVIIGERDGAISSAVRIIFGVCLALFSVVILLLPVFGTGRPDFSKYTIGSWLLCAFLFCVMAVFAYNGLLVAFVRSHVEAASGKIVAGNTWFGLPVRLKVIPVSTAIKLEWECHGFVGKHWVCVGSILSVKNGKPVPLFSCSKRESSLELANAIGEITKLPVQDIPQS
jgi:hypothetical protein